MSICVHVCSLQHLHCTSMVTSLIPTPLSAMDLQSLTSCLLMLTNGMLTTLLSESVIHVMLGVGLPSAKHFSVTVPPTIKVSPVISLMLGGTETREWQGINSSETHQIYVVVIFFIFS